MGLFRKKPDPSCLRPQGLSENNYNYYELCSRADSLAVRKLLTSWFDDYPAKPKKRAILRGEFKANNVSFASAFYEILLYRTLVALKCDVEIEPVSGVEGDPIPDFRVTLPSGSRVYVEAVRKSGESDSDRNIRTVRNAFYDYFDLNFESPDFFWCITEKAHGKTAPDMENLLDQVSRYAAGLKWEPPLAFPIRTAAAITINNNGWIFAFEPVPRLESSRRSITEKPILMRVPKCTASRTVMDIRRAFWEKLDQHPVLSHPLVIAVDIGNLDVDEGDVLSALYGNARSPFKPDAKSSTLSIHDQAGLWWGPEGTRNQHIPYVLISKGISVKSFPDLIVEIHRNPYARFDPDLELPRLPKYGLDNGGLAHSASQPTLGNILKVESAYYEPAN